MSRSRRRRYERYTGRNPLARSRAAIQGEPDSTLAALAVPVCELTGSLAVSGACPEHGPAGCLVDVDEELALIDLEGA